MPIPRRFTRASPPADHPANVDRRDRRARIPGARNAGLWSRREWGVSPDDERAHGKDERIPVQSLWDNILHWERMVKELAS